MIEQTLLTGPRVRWGLIVFGSVVFIASLFAMISLSGLIPWEFWRTVFKSSAEYWIFGIIAGIGAIAIIFGTIALIRSAQPQEELS